MECENLLQVFARYGQIQHFLKIGAFFVSRGMQGQIQDDILPFFRVNQVFRFRGLKINSYMNFWYGNFFCYTIFSYTYLARMLACYRQVVIASQLMYLVLLLVYCICLFFVFFFADTGFVVLSYFFSFMVIISCCLVCLLSTDAVP